MTNVLNEVLGLTSRPPRSRGILDVAYDLPDGWETGVTFRTSGCLEPEVLAVCHVDSVDPVEGVRPGDSPVFEPIFVRQSAACATMSVVGTVDMSRNRLEATTEYALGQLLLNGGVTANPSLADATSVANVGSIAEALVEVVAAVGCLEQAVAETAYGAEAFLHAPYRAAAWLKAVDAMDDDGYSPAGFRWIVSPGYSGGATTTITIWATGAVWAGATPSYTLSDGLSGRTPGWRTNLDEAWSQRLVLAAFDPCLNLSATFPVPACT